MATNSVSFRVGGYGTHPSYTDAWAYANVKITTNGSVVDWSITMDTAANGSGNIPLIRFTFKIDNQSIYSDKGFSNYGQGFPCKDGSSKSGSITLKNSNIEKIPIYFSMAISQSEHQYKKETTLANWEAVKAGTVKIVDNYNNTFSITGTAGTAGFNNPTKGHFLGWSYDAGSYSNEYSKPVTIPATSGNTKKVYAASITYATHGSDASAVATADIKHYIAPLPPGGVMLDLLTNERLTVRKPWRFTWSAGVGANTHSPVVGYRIRLYKNNETIAIYAADGSRLSNEAPLSSGAIVYDRDSTSCEITIDPKLHGFKSGDTVKLEVGAYTKMGKENTGARIHSAISTASAAWTVQSAGTVQVKVGDEFKEGQVYVKVNNDWKEADTVSIKTSDGWMESK